MQEYEEKEGVRENINWHITRQFDTVGNILLRIINKSLETGIFPEDWKESMVIPVEKIRNTIKCEEYRPINILRTCEKIIEKIVAIEISIRL